MSGIFEGSKSSSSSAATDSRQAIDGTSMGGSSFNKSSGNVLTYSPTFVASDENAMKFAEKALGAAGAVAIDSVGRAMATTGQLIGATDSMLANTLASNTHVTNESMNVTLDAVRNTLAYSSESTRQAINSANESAARSAESARISSEVSASVSGSAMNTVATIADRSMDNVTMIADRAQGYAWESASDALGLTSSVVAAAFEASNDLNRLSLGTVSAISDAYQSARETEVTAQFQDYRYILIAGIAVIGIVAFKAMK